MTVRLKQLAELVTAQRDGGIRPFIALENIEGGTGHLATRIEDIPVRSTADAGCFLVEPGDVLFGKLRPYLAKTWRSDRAIYASTELLALHPRSKTDSRWLSYLMSSSPIIEWAIATSEGAKMPRTSWEKMRLFTLACTPELRAQRAIADYLDAETARIDALIAKKQRMVDLLEEKRKSLFDAVLKRRGFLFPQSFEDQIDRKELPRHWRMMHLSQTLMQLTNGFVGPTRDILVDEGVRYVQLLHIKSGEIDFDRRPFYVRREWHDERPRIHLRKGDVLIVQTGDIGQVAVVQPNFGEASCHALQIARVRSEIISGEFLGAFLRSPYGYQSLLSRATGALHPHLEGGIRDIPVVVPPLDVQNEILGEILTESAPLHEVRLRLTAQAKLLQERRQSLITAAVTGQLDIPEVSHGND